QTCLYRESTTSSIDAGRCASPTSCGGCSVRVASLNVGMPRQVEWDGRTILTGIFKNPVATKRPVRRLNIDGDEQADLSVHGGPDKAVYAYPGEHYAFWEEQLGRALAPGSFGE